MRTEDIHLVAPLTPDGSSTLDLAATLYLPGDSSRGERAPALIVGHGAGSRRSRHAEFCRRACSAGFVVLALDFRGHGESAGTANGPAELDIQAAAAYLRIHPAVDPGKICYRGSSMGGFYGLKAAASVKFVAMALLSPATEAVILHGLDEYQSGLDTEAPAAQPGAGAPAAAPPAPSADRGAHQEKAAAPRWEIAKLREYFREQDSLALARSVDCPVLLIHARTDEVVPFTHTLLLTQALPTDTTLVALAEGTHTTAQHDPHIHALTTEWLRAQITSCSERT